MEWLMLPIDTSRPHDVGVLVSWHGRVMVLAWAVLLPIGVLLARYFKVAPGQDWPSELDNHTWWHGHLLLQHIGAALTIIGLVLILLETGGTSSRVSHYLPGYVVFGICMLMVLAGWFRGSKGGPTDQAADGSLSGDHYDMSKRRVVFEYLHKFGGYLALVIAFLALFSGLWHANAARWMWSALVAWWILLIGLFILFQRRGMALDTYQAIWGTDPAHPGNRRKPIGFGIQRR